MSQTLTNAARRLNSYRPLTAGGVPAALVVSDVHRLPQPGPVMARLGPRVGLLFRHYGVEGREHLARHLARSLAARRQILIIAGSDWRLAASLGAGIHLGEAALAKAPLAPLLGWVRRRHVPLTVAVHSRPALSRLRRLGAVGLLSPVFPTASHPGAPVLGAVRFALWARQAGMPLLALGGITAQTAKSVRFACGLAAIGGWGHQGS